MSLRSICCILVLAPTAYLTSTNVEGQASASAKANMLEEVVVTARKREENLQSLPMSIQAITADAIEAQGILDVQDASNFIPNVTLAQDSRANHTAVVVRGIGGSSPDASIIYGSAMYIDGHYVPGRQGGFMSSLDIERIEVLRGPQGTLFGKNVTGGLVNIITARPHSQFESKVTLRAATENQFDVRGMINFPITENLFARLAISREARDGYYYNRQLDTDVGAKEVVAFNGGLRYQPTDSWTFDLAYNRQDKDDDQGPRQCNPFDGSASGQGNSLDALFYPGLKEDFLAACADDAAQGTYVTSSDHVGFSNILVQSAFLAAQWDSDGAVGPLDSASLRVKGSYQSSGYEHYYDRDSTFYDIGEMGNALWSDHCDEDCGQEMLTRGLEVIFDTQVNDRLAMTLGFNSFYERVETGDGICRERYVAAGIAALDPDQPFVTGPGGGLVPNPANPDITNGIECSDVPSGLIVAPHIGSPNPFIIQNRGETESLGIFAHVTYDLNEKWTLDAGTRWSKDDREWWNFESGILGCSTDDQSLRSLGNIPADAAEGLCTFQYQPTFESVVLNGLNNELQGDWSDITSMLSLSRHLQSGDVIDDGMMYFLYSEGFLSGGFNTELNVALLSLSGQRNDVLFVGPENVSNYEIGFKGTLFGGKLQIAADIFYMDYSDKQEEIDIPNEGGAFGPDDGEVSIVSNVAAVDISGIELELKAQPWEGGYLSIDAGYLKNKYASFEYPDPADPTKTVDASGTVIADLTPKWTINVGLEHQFTLASGASITPRAQLYAQDSYDYIPSTLGAAASQCKQDSYAKLNLRATYVPARGNWQAAIFGNNVTDERIYETCDSGGGYGAYHYRHERPFWWGVEFTLHFGA